MWFLCEYKTDNFSQPFVGMNITPTPLPFEINVTPSPFEDLSTYEVGAISKFGDTVVLLREEDHHCKPNMRTRNVQDIMLTSAGLRKDLRKFGDIMSVNFQDDPVKLSNLFNTLDKNRQTYNNKSEDDLIKFENNMSIHFGTSEDGLLLSYPTESCGKSEPNIVHTRIVELGKDTYDHANFVLKDSVEHSKKITPIRVSLNNNFLYIKIGERRYALTVITSRDKYKNTTHDIDFILIAADTDEEMLAPPNTLQIWEPKPGINSLREMIIKEYTQYQDYFKDTLYRIQRRVVSLTGSTLKTDEQKMMSITLPPVPDSVSERELYVKKINAEVTAAAERALAATEEVKSAVELHDEASRVALDALAAKTQSELKLSQKKEELELVKKRLGESKTELGIKKREFEMKAGGLSKLDILIEQKMKKAKALNEKATKALQQPKISTENSQAAKKLQEDANEIADDVIELKRERAQFKQQSDGLIPEIQALDKDREIIEGELDTIKDILQAADIANRSRTDTMAKTTATVGNLRRRIEPAKKAELQMKQIAKQIELDSKQKLIEFDKKLEAKAKAESERIDRQFAADQAAEARAREERLTYEAKIRASSAGNIENVNSATRQLLKKASKELDSQREAASRLEDQVDSLVKALAEQDNKVEMEAQKGTNQAAKEGFANYKPMSAREMQFMKYC
tara:strand:+ start:4040 stop:6094 length:2055 start_codon:yes stop_codon:yes gene_type:complete